jgi:hypothetical protein
MQKLVRSGVHMMAETTKLVRFQVSADADPSVVGRLLSCFQNLNLIPRRIIAEFSTTALMHIQIDISDLSEERVTLIAGKMQQHVSVLNSQWYWLT